MNFSAQDIVHLSKAFAAKRHIQRRPPRCTTGDALEANVDTLPPRDCRVFSAQKASIEAQNVDKQDTEEVSRIQLKYSGGIIG